MRGPYRAVNTQGVQGREFTSQDDQHAPAVAVINQTFMRRFFPNGDGLGKRVRLNEREVEIVGVVADTKYRKQREELQPLLYTPWQQEAADLGEMHFALRAAGDPNTLAAQVREVVHGLDNNLPVTEIGTQSARAQTTLAQERLYARLFGFFGVVALALAGIGLFGVLAYSVSQRTKEIGVRMAFGARAAKVVVMVIWQGMKLVLVGLSVGSLIGFTFIRLLNSRYFGPDTWQQEMKQQLYGVTVSDPFTLIVVASLLTLVALIACWLPARRAAKVDPLVALRHE